MSHLVLDSTTLDALIAAGDAVNHAADNRLCSCEFNVPYESGQVVRFLVAKCFRCRATEQWTEARAVVAKAINESTAKGGQAEADALKPSPTAESAAVHGSSAGPHVATP